jgi:hypothetical protein
MSRTRRFAVILFGWALVCTILFFALDGMEDPSRPKGRMLSIEAGQRAQAILNQQTAGGYEVVHVARARRGEGAPENRWVVLLDKVPHTALRDAMVVELDEETGKLLRIRKAKR